MSAKQILAKHEIIQIIKRMAFEIYEQNHAVNEIYLAGIDDNGVKIAEMIAENLKEISPIQPQLLRIDIEKDIKYQPKVEISNWPTVDDFSLVVIDDVLNSGRTMMYAICPFLELKVHKLQTAVLVNRSHKRFPIAVDFKGLELGTTIEEHIQVSMDDDDYSAALY